jgi:hypothetical protein
MDDAVLRTRLFEQVERSVTASRRLAEDPDDAVLFTGRCMSAAEFATHSRSERVLHRWDIVGRDDIGWAMLAQPELTLHALKILTEMPVLAETWAIDSTRPTTAPGILPSSCGASLMTM